MLAQTILWKMTLEEAKVISKEAKPARHSASNTADGPQGNQFRGVS